MSQRVIQVTGVLFLLFLIFFMEYKPYEQHNQINSTTTQQIFSLYFFISNQALGIVHEAGHGVCYILNCPKFLTALNGTFFQLLFPLFVALHYKYHDNKLGYYIGLFFVGFSLHYTSWYISTAHITSVVKANQSFLGVDGYHDFHYILKTLGLLSYDTIIAGFTKFIATMMMFYSVLRMLFFGFVSDSKKENIKPK
jgi:hypothetical protein